MTAAFDTLKLADKLEAAGFNAQQARGAATALSESMTAELATKADLADLRSDLKIDISGVRSDVLILKWMMGFLLALQVAVFVKLFLH